MTYTKGIPSEPGLYWYRETLDGDAILIWVMIDEYSCITAREVEIAYGISWPDYEADYSHGYFTPAIAPEPDDKE